MGSEGRRSATPAGVALITGAGGGMGAACARRFAGTHRLLLAEASAERLERIEAELSAAGAEVAGLVCDVTDRDSVASLARRAAGAGPLSALVHTAGLSRSMADGPRVMEVNLVGTALMLAAFLPLAGAGSVVVCVASIGGHRTPLAQFDALLDDPSAPGFQERFEQERPLAGRPGLAYDISKRGVIMLCEREARIWGAAGARIVSISPGLIDTPMGRLEMGAGARGLDEIAALARAGQAEEIAEVAWWLCGPRASYVTGCDIRVDGGQLADVNHHAPAEVRDAWNALRREG